MKKKIIYISVLAVMSMIITGCGTDENLVTDSKSAQTAITESAAETGVTQTKKSDDNAGADEITITNQTSQASEKNDDNRSDSEEYSDSNIETATGVSVKALDGVWFGNNEYPDRLIIDNGEYMMVNDYSKMFTEGKVKLEKKVSADGINKYNYNLYDNAGTLTESFEVTGEIPLNDLIPTMSDIKFMRDESGITKDPAPEDYKGEWTGPRPMISISGNGSEYEVKVTWGSSASERSVWTYPCEYDTADKTLKCNGKGVKKNLVTDDNGNQTETTESTDCSAVFSMTYGVLTWDDKTSVSTEGFAFTKD